MPKVVFTHPVKNRDEWASKHAERVELFSSWGSNIVQHLGADGSNNVALSIDVHDMDGMKAALDSPEIAERKQAHGVLEPISMFIAPD